MTLTMRKYDMNLGGGSWLQ